jgi:hypothetical protein
MNISLLKSQGVTTAIVNDTEKGMKKNIIVPKDVTDIPKYVHEVLDGKPSSFPENEKKEKKEVKPNRQ